MEQKSRSCGQLHGEHEALLSRTGHSHQAIQNILVSHGNDRAGSRY